MGYQLKYWIGGAGLLLLYTFAIILILLQVFSLSISAEIIIFISFGLLMLISYLLDAHISVALRGTGANSALKFATKMKDLTEIHNSETIRIALKQARAKEVKERIKHLKKIGRQDMIPEVLERFDDPQNGYVDYDYPSQMNLGKNILANTSPIIAKMQYHLSAHLPLVLCTIIPGAITIIGLIFHASLFGEVVYKYGAAILSLILGLITINIYKDKTNKSQVILSLIGFIARLCVIVLPIFYDFTSIIYFLVCTQLGICGFISEISHD